MTGLVVEGVVVAGFVEGTGVDSTTTATTEVVVVSAVVVVVAAIVVVVSGTDVVVVTGDVVEVDGATKVAGDDASMSSAAVFSGAAASV